MTEQIISLVKQIKDLKEQLDKLFIGDGSQEHICSIIDNLLKTDEKFSVCIYDPYEGLGGYQLSKILTGNLSNNKINYHLFTTSQNKIIIKYDNVDISSYMINVHTKGNPPIRIFTLTPLVDWTDSRGWSYR